MSETRQKQNLKGIEITIDNIPGGFEIAFFEPDAYASFAAVALNRDDCRALVEMMVRAGAVKLAEVRP